MRGKEHTANRSGEAVHRPESGIRQGHSAEQARCGHVFTRRNCVRAFLEGNAK